MVHLEARRLGLKGVEAELIPKFASVIKRAWHLFIALIALVSLLLLDFTPFLAAFWGIILSIVCSYIPPLARRVGLGELEGETLTPRRLVKAFEEGAKSALAIGAVCACVGLILGTLTLSGLGFKFSGAVVDLSAEVAQWFVAIDFTNDGRQATRATRLGFGDRSVACAVCTGTIRQRTVAARALRIGRYIVRDQSVRPLMRGCQERAPAPISQPAATWSRLPQRTWPALWVESRCAEKRANDDRTRSLFLMSAAPKIRDDRSGR